MQVQTLVVFPPVVLAAIYGLYVAECLLARSEGRLRVRPCAVGILHKMA